jgi:hypothetical protein
METGQVRKTQVRKNQCHAVRALSFLRLASGRVFDSLDQRVNKDELLLLFCCKFL